MWPPGKDLWRRVFPLSLALGSAILPRKAGVSRTIGARRSLDQASAMSRVGWSSSIGAGSWSTWNPMMLLTSSVLPIWAELMTTTMWMAGSLTASIIPRWYSARAVIQRPGSALDSAESRRLLSAHCETVRRGGSRQRSADLRSLLPIASLAADVVEIVEGRGVSLELIADLGDHGADQVPGAGRVVGTEQHGQPVRQRLEPLVRAVDQRVHDTTRVLDGDRLLAQLGQLVPEQLGLALDLDAPGLVEAHAVRGPERVGPGPGELEVEEVGGVDLVLDATAPDRVDPQALRDPLGDGLPVHGGDDGRLGGAHQLAANTRRRFRHGINALDQADQMWGCSW